MTKRLHPVGGVRVGTGAGAIKQSKRDDVAVFAFDKPVPTAATFTRNHFAAAPVKVARSHVRGGKSQAWLINSGNANCGTGQRGMSVATNSCAHLSASLNIATKHVVPFSTGTIMEQLSPARLHAGCDKAVTKLSANNWKAAANAIMTTDRYSKGTSLRVAAKGGNVTVTGVAKGAGMIHPNMATMLAFIATDASVPAKWLRACLRKSVGESFNAISVDGDTSTNDAVIIAATGAAGEQTAGELGKLEKAIEDVCSQLAHLIVNDGEGATTTATVTVTGLASNKDCNAVVDAVACSPLIKTMLFARDANLGRLLMAIGKAPVKLQPEAVSIFINDKSAFRAGMRVPQFTEAVATRQMKTNPVKIEIRAGKKKTKASRTFCDFGHDYIRINAEYRS